MQLEQLMLVQCELSEQTVLGTLMTDPTAFERIAGVVTDGDFYTQAHREIFSVIREMFSRDKPTDVVSVIEAISGREKLNLVGGREYLAKLATETINVNLEHHAERVAEMSRRRKLAVAAAKMSDVAMLAGFTSSGELAAQMQRLLDEATGETQGGEFGRIDGAFRELLADIDKRADSELAGLTTSLRDLDELTNGLQPGQLWILAARPAMGKSALAEQIALTNAKQGKSVLVFSLEMSVKAWLERAVSNDTHLSAKAMRRGKLREEDYDRLTMAMSSLSGIPLYVDAAGCVTVESMRARAKQVKAAHGLDLIVVDYLQLMSATGGDLREQVTNISRGLKMLAQNLSVPVLALSQLSRKCDDRTDKRPQPADLRESGSIEQDADVVLMLYREEIYRPDTDAKNIAEVIVRKQRDGEQGTVYTYFTGDNYRFNGSDWRPSPVETRTRKGFVA